MISAVNCFCLGAELRELYRWGEREDKERKKERREREGKGERAREREREERGQAGSFYM